MSDRRAHTRILLIVLALLVPALLLAACGGDDESTTEESACATVDAPPAKDVELDPPTEKAPTATDVVFETSCGSFTVTLDPETNPKTAASFQYLAENGVYDDTLFHRVAPGFVIQGGDPTGDGTGGPGYSITERPPSDLSYTRGLVAMAKTSAEPPGTSGSQFFIVTADADAGLPPDYAIAGEVTDGFDTVEAIEALGGGPGSDGPPSQPVITETATVEE